MEFEFNYMLVIRRLFVDKSDFVKEKTIPWIKCVYTKYVGPLDSNKRTLALSKLTVELLIHNKILLSKAKVERSRLNILKKYASVSFYNVISNSFWLKQFILRLTLFFDFQTIITDLILSIRTKFFF